MANKTLTRGITILEDGKLKATEFGGNIVYMQPTIVVDTLNNVSELIIRGRFGNSILVDTTLKNINGKSFSGDFANLETKIRGLAKNANSDNLVADLLRGPNLYTDTMTVETKAQLADTLYMMVCIKASEDIRIVLKNIIGFITTIDDGKICVFKNPTFDVEPVFEPSPLIGSKMIQGNISNDPNTEQIMTGGVFIAGLPLDTGEKDSINLNRELQLVEDDIIALGFIGFGLNSDIVGFLSWLE